MGRNGARRISAGLLLVCSSTVVLAKPRTDYGLAAGTFCRLDSNAVIKADQPGFLARTAISSTRRLRDPAISAARLG